MYEAHWELRESPFRNRNRLKYFFPGASHEESLARMHFLVEQRRMLGVLSGGDGCGKSLTLAVLAGELAGQGHRVLSQNLTGLDGRSLALSLATGLHAHPPRNADAFALWRLVEDAVEQLALQGIATALLLDDADQATAESRLLIRRIVKVLDGKVSVILAAETGDRDPIDEFAKLVDLYLSLEPWDEGETADFLRRSLQTAGGDAEIFTPLAGSRIFELTGGVPRQVCHLADLALIAGASQQLSAIDEGTVEIVFHELAHRPSNAALVAAFP